MGSYVCNSTNLRHFFHAKAVFQRIIQENKTEESEEPVKDGRTFQKRKGCVFIENGFQPEEIPEELKVTYFQHIISNCLGLVGKRQIEQFANTDDPTCFDSSDENDSQSDSEENKELSDPEINPETTLKHLEQIAPSDIARFAPLFNKLENFVDLESVFEYSPDQEKPVSPQSMSEENKGRRKSRGKRTNKSTSYSQLNVLSIFKDHLVNTIKRHKDKPNASSLMNNIAKLIKIKKEFDQILGLEDFIGHVDPNGILIPVKVKFEFDSLKYLQKMQAEEQETEYTTESSSEKIKTQAGEQNAKFKKPQQAEKSEKQTAQSHEEKRHQKRSRKEVATIQREYDSGFKSCGESSDSVGFKLDKSKTIPDKSPAHHERVFKSKAIHKRHTSRDRRTRSAYISDGVSNFKPPACNPGCSFENKKLAEQKRGMANGWPGRKSAEKVEVQFRRKTWYCQEKGRK